jgi:CRISPR-associated protein Cas6
VIETDAPLARMLDVFFPLEGSTLPRDHRQALADALQPALPWLRDSTAAGIHPVNLVHGVGEPALLSHRARLGLRVPRERLDELEPLAGQVIEVSGHRLRIGAPRRRELLPHNTLYAHFVAAAADDEVAFMQSVERELDALGAACRRICGWRQVIRTDDQSLSGFSLMLHGLGADDSLRVLEAGVGAHRRLGCGLFNPHRSAAAVGL